MWHGPMLVSVCDRSVDVEALNYSGIHVHPQA
jgi:hypothetical protein